LEVNVRKATATCLGLILCLSAIAAQEKVSIAAAANISSVAPALSESFAKKYPAYRAEFTFGASGALVTQLMNGAPFQVFLSADTSFPQKLVDAGETEGPVKVYAVGALIFLTTKKLDLSKGLAVLADPSVAQFANCNPETAPYGRAAQEALRKAGLFDEVKSKLVLAQTVTQALQFTLTSADAGFVNKSALYSKEVRPYDKEGEYWFAVDPSLYSPIEQGFVVMKGSGADPAVSAFARFLTSPEALAVFASFGYGSP
jgi:molybdate transport system substrate-binding protein